MEFGVFQVILRPSVLTGGADMPGEQAGAWI